MSAGRSGRQDSRRVLFLAARLGPGGVTTHIATLGTALQQHGWDVAVASAGAATGHSHDVAWLERQGIRHYEIGFPQVMWSRDMLRVPQAASRCLRIARAYEPDIVHVHWRSTAWCAQVLRWRLGIPFVITVHVEGIPSNHARRALSFWGDAVITVSSDAQKDLSARFNLPLQRVRVIPYGVDETYFREPDAIERAEARRAFGIDAQETVVSLIGSDWRRKGHDVLIRASAILRERGTPIRVLLAGSETDRPMIQHLVGEHRVADRVSFLGYTESRGVLWASDILALPSRVEGLPIAVIEAMLCGVVPIRTPASGAGDQIIEGQTGFIIPFDDANALAERLHLLCTDAPRRVAMQQAGLMHARGRFTSARMTEDVLDVYQGVIERRA